MTEFGPAPEVKISMVDIFRFGHSSVKSEKMKRIANSLAWRHAHQGSDIYPIELSDGRTLNVRQISNGETKGLGTGTCVWPAAHVLSKYIEKRFGYFGLVGKRVCDIGSGTGCTGFVAAALGAEATLTDQRQLIDFMVENKRNVCSEVPTIREELIKVSVYDWGASIDHLKPPFDIVLVSDCVLPKLYPIEPLVQAVAAVMGPTSIAIFSYEHRPYPYFDPRHEFARLAKRHGMSVRTIPLSEHDSYYCTEDIELWEVSLHSESIGTALDPLDPGDSDLRPMAYKAGKMVNGTRNLDQLVDRFKYRDNDNDNTTRRESSGDTDTAGNSPSDDSITDGTVRMLTWGSLPRIDAIVGGKRLSIQQVVNGGIGCYLWASSVILSRFILSARFQEQVSTRSRGRISLSSSPTSLRPIAIELGAGCGLTAIALLQRGVDVIATDKASVMEVLRNNIGNYLQQLHHAGNRSSPAIAEVAEFDWFGNRNYQISDSLDVSNKLNIRIARVLEHHQKDFETTALFGDVNPDPRRAILGAMARVQSARGVRPPSPAEDDNDNTSPGGSKGAGTSRKKNIGLDAKNPVNSAGNPSSSSSSPSSLSSSSSLRLRYYPDLVVCSDCLYSTASVQPLLDALNWLCGPDTLLVVANELRTAFDEFLTAARRGGDNYEEGVTLGRWEFEDVELTGEETEVYRGPGDSTVNRPVRVLFGRKILV